MRLRYSVTMLALAAAFTAVTASRAGATEVWSGRTFQFSKTSGANPALAANQDRITNNVWITRGSSAGTYNAFSEAAYTHNVSPAGTEWATGDAVNHASLTFAPWEIWNGQSPPSMIGVDACVHLITDDIYLDIRYTAWQSAGSGGAFTYLRAVRPQGTPTDHGTWGALKALYR
jgi:hypothetical protein